MALVLVTPAASYPVTLTEVKAQCRVDGTDDDTKLNSLIAAATDYVERYTGRAIVSQTWKVVLDEFADEMLLPKGPVQSVSSITYTDTAGDPQTLSASVYTADLANDPQRVVLNDGQSWPETDDAVNVVTITFVAGYSAVPESLKHAILLLISQWYDNRDGLGGGREMPHAVEALLCNHRSFTL